MPDPLHRHDVMLPRPKRWYEGEGYNRLIHDRQLLAANYPTLSQHIDNVRGQVHVEGIIRLIAECGVPTDIAVRLEFPWSYPEHEPLAYDLDNRFPRGADGHLTTDGRYCLWLPPKSRWDPTDPDALVHFLNELALFLDQRLTYEAEGKDWPGEEWGHNAAGYIEFVLEKFDGNQKLLDSLAPVFAGRYRLPGKHKCLCGSGLKYKKCHLGLVQEIKQEVGAELLQRVFNGYRSNLPAVTK